MTLRVASLAFIIAAWPAAVPAGQAPQPRIRTLDVVAADPADTAVVRGLWTSRPGGDFRSEQVAADLHRLGAVGCIPARFRAEFDGSGVGLSLEAAPVSKPLSPLLASVEIVGGAPEIDRRCRPLMSQRPSTLFQARRIDYHGMLLDVGQVEYAYRSAGYLNARVRVLELVGGADPAGARIVIRVEPGELHAQSDAQPEKRSVDKNEPPLLGRVIIDGAGKLCDDVMRRIELRPGEPISTPALDAVRRAIEDLGHFAGIELRLVSPPGAPTDRRDLVVRLTRLAPTRDVCPGEELYYEVVKKVIRLYNSGGPRSLRLRGFTTWEGQRIHVDAALSRPDWLRLRIALGDDEPRTEFGFLRNGRRSVIVLPGLIRPLELPESITLGFRFAILPPDAAGAPTRVDLGAAVTSGTNATDVLLLGPPCPPVAAHFTGLARSFALAPPQLDAAGILSFADPDNAEGRIRLVVSPDRLPRLLTRRSASGQITSQFEIEINPELTESAPPLPANTDHAAGRALIVPILFALGLTDAAAQMADDAAADYPDSAACLAVRGLARLASGPTDLGLADLRAAYERSAHPAYALLFAETLISGRRFREAADICSKLIVSGATPAAALDPADLILAANISVRSAIDTLTNKPPDYQRRAVADCAVAYIGLGQYKEAARLAATLLADAPTNTQAIEILARSRLSLGQADAALDAISKVDAGTRNAQLDVYAAFAQVMLNNEAEAALALGRAMRNAPATARNLVLLQERAAEIHERFQDPSAAATLARAFDRAERALFPIDPSAKPAAFVNGIPILESDVEALLARSGRRDADTRRRALNQLIEDALIVRWAVAHGGVASEEQVDRVLAEEALSVGVSDIAAYAEWLEANGSALAERRTRITHSILKQQAFSRAIAETALVRPADVRAYYDEHLAEFHEPAVARFRMITLEYRRFPDNDRAVELAGALLRHLREKPDDFADTAREYSHDANRDSGGLWDDVGRGSLVHPLDEAVFTAKPGEVVGPIRSEKACHIIRVEDVRPERTLSLEEAAPRIVRKLHTLRARAEISAWIERLKGRSYIEIVGATSNP